MNGSIINGQTTNVPSSLSVVSLRTIGNVEADNFVTIELIHLGSGEGSSGNL